MPSGTTKRGRAKKRRLIKTSDLEVVTLTDIVWDVVTVTEYDLASVATNALVSSASSSTTTTVPSPPAVAQTSTNTPVVAVPITTSQPPAQVSPSTSQTSSPSPSSPEAVAVTVAVAAAPTTATVESAAATSPDAAASTTTTTTASGEYSGDGTFYELGLTACGQTYTDSDYVAAISYLLFDQDATANPNGRELHSTSRTRANQIKIILIVAKK